MAAYSVCTVVVGPAEAWGRLLEECEMCSLHPWTSRPHSSTIQGSAHCFVFGYSLQFQWYPCDEKFLVEAPNLDTDHSRLWRRRRLYDHSSNNSGSLCVISDYVLMADGIIHSFIHPYQLFSLVVRRFGRSP